MVFIAGSITRIATSYHKKNHINRMTGLGVNDTIVGGDTVYGVTHG